MRRGQLISNRNIFSCYLNCLQLMSCRKWDGRLFHTRGTALRLKLVWSAKNSLSTSHHTLDNSPRPRAAAAHWVTRYTALTRRPVICHAISPKSSHVIFIFCRSSDSVCHSRTLLVFHAFSFHFLETPCQACSRILLLSIMCTCPSH